MARTNRSSPRTLVLRRSVPIEVKPLPFRPFAGIKKLDLEALARVAAARIEVGYYETGCCRRLVHAVLRKGAVIGFEVEPCQDPVPMSAEWTGILRDAHRALRARSGPGYKLPIPVQQLPGAVARIKYSFWVCVRICAFGRCLMCCVDKSHVNSPWFKCSISRKP